MKPMNMPEILIGSPFASEVTPYSYIIRQTRYFR